MVPVIPWYVAVVVVTTTTAIAVAITAVTAWAARRGGLPEAARRRVLLGVGSFAGAWLGAALAFAPAPSSLAGGDPFALSPQIPLFAAASIVIGLAALRWSPSLRRAIAAVPLPALHLMQVWRVVGVVFLFLLARGQLPAHFAHPAGWGDIFVGAAAPVVALLLSRGARGATALAVSWNVFGLLDLVVAVGMGTGFLAPLFVPELGPRVPPAAAMGMFPMILVPTFAVPASVLLHLITLGRLLKRSDGAVASTPAIAG